MIIISDELVLSESFAELADNPIIAYDNVVPSGSITATTEATDAPATNLLNPATYLRWESGQDEDDDDIIITFPDGAEADYIAIASHNFGSNRNVIIIDLADTADEFGAPIFDDRVQEVSPGDDTPMLVRFSMRGIIAARIRVTYTVTSGIAFCGVLYLGKLLVMQRKIYVGHTPITMGRSVNVLNGRSENGQYLGRVILGEKASTVAEFKNLTPDWVRGNIVPFLRAADDGPFFFAWRPQSYPREVGYAWLSADARPVNDLPNGLMSVSLNMDGIVT